MNTRPPHGDITITCKARLFLLLSFVCMSLVIFGTTVAQAQSGNLVFGSVSIQWTDSIAVSAMRHIETVSTTVFSGVAAESAFGAAVCRVLVALESDGYRQAIIKPRDFSSDDASLNVTLQITPGPRSRVIDYNFANLTHTDTLWLKQLVNQPVGVPLTATWLLTATARLSRLSSVRVTSAPEVITVDESPDGMETSVIVRWSLEEDRNARLDGVLAAGGEGDQSGLTGRAAMQFDGLFGRDRSIAVRYNRPRPEWNALNLRFDERGAFGSPLDWGVELDASNQRDRRQRLATRVGWSFGASADWLFGAGAAWQRVTPAETAGDPSRNIDASLGIEKPMHRTTRFRTTESHGSLWTTLSHRQVFDGGDGATTDRLRLDGQASLTHVLGDRWDLTLASMARAWMSGGDALSFGDEWYLGGPDHLRGYDDQAFAAASGVWGTAEIGYWVVPSLGLALFGEAAHFDQIELAGVHTEAQSPLDYGAALRLVSAGRIGRLEFAWRRDAAVRDGFVRLKVTQSW